jgi:hypothetical protein
MSSGAHVSTYDGEALEIVAFPGKQRIADEVRNDPLEDVIEPACFPLHRSIAAIRPDAPAPEIRRDRVNDFGPISILADREAWPHLPAHRELGSRRDGHGEATFSVDITGDIGREELATATRAGV